MRIARVMTRLNLGGPARQALASDRWLRERGHAVRLFTGEPEPGEGDLTAEFRAQGHDVRRIPGLARGVSLLGDWRALRALKRELAEFRPDVVHTHASKAGALGRRAARELPQAARVHTFHGHVLEGYFPAPVSKALIALETRLARETDLLIAVSHATAEDLERLGVSQGRLAVVPPGIELDPFLALRSRHGALRKEIGASESDFVVGMVGRLAEVKQPLRALEIFEFLAPSQPALQLAFIGDGELFTMLERRILAMPADLARRVHLLGARTDMPVVLADLDCVLLTSRSEGLPVALIEAGAAGKPVVAASVGGVAELVVHERTGFLGESNDELAFGLAQLLDNRQLGPAFGQRARLRIDKRHSAAALGAHLESLYRQLAEVRA